MAAEVPAQRRPQVRVVSQGLFENTTVSADGKHLENVLAVDLAIRAPGFVTATITVEHVEVDMIVVDHLRFGQMLQLDDESPQCTISGGELTAMLEKHRRDQGL